MASGRRHTHILCVYIAAVSAIIVSWTAPGLATSTSWTPLAALAPDSAGTMLLLTDGTVMVQGYNPASNWMRLTPDSSGSYINGTWSSLAPMSIPRLYYASHVLPSGKVWVLGGEYSGIGLPANWTNTGEMYDPVSDTWSPITPHPEARFGDDPSMLLPNGQILAGSLSTGNTYLYDIDTDTWSFEASKVYVDRSDEESWVKLPGNKVLTYDLFQSIATFGGYAELYDPTTHSWSSISPSDGTASGDIPQVSSAELGFELGAIVRLRRGRIFVIGATGHTARYNPATNTWKAGPDIVGTLNGNPAPFGADDAPAAVLPNGHVLFAADAGPASTISTGNITSGSAIITAIPSTDNFQRSWTVAGTGIVAGSRIVSVDSPNQVHISTNATVTSNGVSLKFGGTFSNPTQIFDFDPVADTISPVAPPSASLDSRPAFVTRMLMLPTGQVLFSDGSAALWVYTPDGAPPPGARPVIQHVRYNGNGLFTLKGRKVNGQSAGTSYGDDVESDENYPIVRLTQCVAGHGPHPSQGPELVDGPTCSIQDPRVFYARTTNWSIVDVATGSARETVDFTLQPGTTPGWYVLEVIGAGISSFPWFVHITAAEIAGL